MRSSDADLLIIPGFGGSGPNHWQTRWQDKLPTARRVAMPDWERPVLSDWMVALARSIETTTRPVVLIAHSLGVLTVVHAAARLDLQQVRGALLVAPPSEAAIADIAMIDPAFRPVPRTDLPFPGALIASQNDPYCDFYAASEFAQTWGVELTDAGMVGHINADSGHGPWPEGLMRLAALMRSL